MAETPIYGANQNPSGSLQTKYLSYYLYILPSKSVYSQPGSPRYLIDILYEVIFTLLYFVIACKKTYQKMFL